jgi:Fe-S-cluster containining protein
VKSFWLNFHLPYACRHTGACCKAGWPIPVEPERAVLIKEGEWLVEDGMLPRNADGACVFHEAHCTVYDHRPMSCVHFPYVCLIDPRGVHVTLSHYCPTAASLLFEHQGSIEIVEGPPPIPGLEMPEGLDARESLPPIREQASSLKPQASSPRLMSWEEFSRWERDELRTLPALIGDVPFAPVIERYVAAKIFASWAAYEDGDGITSIRLLARAAYQRLLDEMELGSRLAGRPVDRDILLQAIRQVDFGLFHLR